MLKLGGEIEDYPKVEITLDKRHRIKSITNEETKLGLIVGENYEIGIVEPPLQSTATKEEKNKLREKIGFDVAITKKTSEIEPIYSESKSKREEAQL